MKKSLKWFISIATAFVFVLMSFVQSNVQAADVNWSDIKAEKHTTTDAKKEWKITFSEAVDADTVNEENVKVTKLTGEPVETEPVVDGRMIIVKPKTSYEVGQSYYLYIGPGIHSVSHKEQAANVRFMFTIEKAGSVPSQPNTIQSVTDKNIVIGGETYTVAENLNGLLKTTNNDALKGAKISFATNGTIITAIEELTLTNKGSAPSNLVLDGGDAVIAGSLFIDGDYYKVKNLTVIGDVTVTGAVNNGFTADKLHVEGTVHVEEAMMVAALSAKIAPASALTKAKIVFKDSTVVYIDIAKKDTYFEATGKTEVTSMRLSANADIFFNPNVILPNVEIGQGVTRIDLNATISEIIIETDEDIELTGSGDFENVIVNSDKNVSIETTGKIGNLKTTTEAGTVTLGDNLSVGDIELPAGKKAEEVISNFNEAKDKIEKIGGNENPDYDNSKVPENPDGHFAAGVLRIPERFGYVKLNIINQGSHSVKYQYFDRFSSGNPSNWAPQIGDEVPKEAVPYQASDEFPLYWDHELYVYQVDNSNRIVDIKKVSNLYTEFPKFDFTGSEVKITTLLKSKENPNDRLTHLSVATEDTRQFIGDLYGGKWGMEDGLHTITVPLVIPVNASDDIMLEIQFPRHSFGTFYGEYSSEKLIISYLKLTGTTAQYGIIGDIEWPLKMLTCGKFNGSTMVDPRCEDYNYTLFNDDYMSLLAYKEETVKRDASLQTAEDVKALIKDVDARMQVELEGYYKALNLVDNLFRENRYEYPYLEQLRPGLTQSDIDEAISAVQLLSNDISEKGSLLSHIEIAQSIFNQLNGNIKM